MADKAATLTMPGYLARIAGREVESALRRRGAVLIEGVRGCGKTWMARHFARSEVRLDDEAALLLASSDPVEVLGGGGFIGEFLESSSASSLRAPANS